jgi:hypothetical protein
MEEKKLQSEVNAAPNDEIAGSISKRLVAEGLLLPNKEEEAKAKIASGSMTKEDWSLYIELALAKKEGEKTND